MSSGHDNVYMFVQRTAESCRLNLEPMYYSIDNTVEQLKCQVSTYQEDLEVITLKVSKQQEALDEMKKLKLQAQS